MTAFATLMKGAAAGIMVTASHNPPEYNGYKVYWGNGAQIIPPHDKGIAAAIDRVEPANEVKLLDAAAARQAGLWTDLTADVASGLRGSHPPAASAPSRPGAGVHRLLRRCTAWAVAG